MCSCMLMCTLVVAILYSYVVSYNCLSVHIMRRYDEFKLDKDMELMMLQLLDRVEEVTCSVILLDDFYQEMVGNIFNHSKSSYAHFKILVNDSEDLLSPNYETLKVIQEVKKNNCNFYAILLANGEQVVRFLTFGDKYRTIDLRAKFVFMRDRRLFVLKYNVLWKKLVNVIFIKRIARGFELLTVPYPPPLNVPVGTYQINTWGVIKSGGSDQPHFQKERILFQDKTSNLQGQVLKVVTFDHMPTTAVIPPSNHSGNIEDAQPRYIGLEIEVLKTLAEGMNFEFTIYEPANANEEQWGRLQTNGSFSGLLGEMCSGTADIALGNLYYTPYHLEVVDLSVPYNTECLTFLTPESVTDNSWQTLYLPFLHSMWMCVFASLFLGSVLFYVLAMYHHAIQTKDFTSVSSAGTGTDLKDESEQPTTVFTRFVNTLRGKWRAKWKQMNRKERFFKKYHETQMQKKHLWQRNLHRMLMSSQTMFEGETENLYVFRELVNCFLYTFGMIMNISLPRIPIVWSIRMFLGCWWMYCILLSNTYKASMTAILANPEPRVTIDTLEELADSVIGCGGWGEQSREFFITSLDVASQKVGRKFEIIYDVDSAVERVASGELAYYENIHYLHYLTVKHKDINVISRYNETDDTNLDKTKGKVLHVMQNCVINMPISVGLQKNSPLKPKIDSYLTRVIEAGLVEKWLNDAMFKIRTTEAERNTEVVKALMNLSKLYGAIAVLLCGYVISIFVLLVELIVWYGYEKRRPEFDEYNLASYYMFKKGKSVKLTD